MYRTRDWRRHKDWRKAIRKKKISDWFSPNHSLYDNLHQYSKNKIHCSCPLCCSKIKNPGLTGPAESWPMQDQRRFEAMNDDLNEEVS